MGPLALHPSLPAAAGTTASDAWSSFAQWAYNGLRYLHLPVGALLVGIGLGLLAYAVVVSLEAIPAASGTGTIQVSVLDEKGDGSASPAPEVRVFSKDGSRVVRMQGAGEHRPVTGRRALRFVVWLTLGFALISVPLLLFYPIIFAYYDQLVAQAGTFLYWPLTWPGVYAVGRTALVVPDYIFPMYLALMAAFVVATGIAFNRPRYTPRRRRRALLTILVYIGVEIVIDALFFTVPGATLRDVALLVRVLTGGLFMALLTFCVFYLPPPQKVTPRFPRDQRATALFLGLGVTTVVISGVALALLTLFVSAHGIATGFTILLLLPVLTLPVYSALARPLYFRRRRRRPLPSVNDYHPPVSIVIPAYNEAEHIVQAIRSVDVASADYPGSVQIVVGNDGSTDRTLELAREAIEHLEHATGLVVDLPHGGKSNALNGALALATGEIVLRLDGDTVIASPPGFAAIIPHFADPEVGGVQGAIHPRQREGWTRKLRALEIAWMHYMLRPATMATRTSEVLDGLFSAFRRKDLVELGGWVPWNGEDSEISMRVQRLGYRIEMEFGALALEDVPANYDALRRQRVRWARGILMANGQHFGALLGPTPEFAGLGILFWLLLVIRSGVRSLVYVYLFVLILILGVPGLVYTAELLLIATVIRAVPIAYFLVKMRRRDVLPWIPFFPIANIVKQNFRFEAFGTLGPGAAAEYV